MKAVPIWEKSNLTLEEAAAYSGIGINRLRELTNDEKCRFYLIMRRRNQPFFSSIFPVFRIEENAGTAGLLCPFSAFSSMRNTKG